VKEGSEDCKRLLERKDNPLGFSALFHVVRGAGASDDSYYLSDHPVLFGAERQHRACLDRLLDLGANIEARDVYGSTPLHHVCISFEGANASAVQVARRLLERGADPHAKDNKGRAPLDYIIGREHSEVFIRLLLEFGVTPGVAVLGLHASILAMSYPKVMVVVVDLQQIVYQSYR
jgi:ankyrin repeat protein